MGADISASKCLTLLPRSAEKDSVALCKPLGHRQSANAIKAKTSLEQQNRGKLVDQASWPSFWGF